MDRYRHTGEVTVRGIALGLLAGGLAGFVLCIPYAYVTVYVPLIIVNVVATMGLGLGIGWCAAKGGRVGMLQSPPAYLMVGLAAGLAAEYWNWVFWIFAVSRQQYLILHPAGIVAVAGDIMKTGTWGLVSDAPLTGIPLLCVWILEAGFIVVVAATTAMQGLTRYFCCPQCRAWFHKPTKTLYYAVPEKEGDIVERLKALQFKCLSELTRVDEKVVSRFLKLDLYFCPSCSRFGCFSFLRVDVVKRRNQAEFKQVKLIDRVMLPTDRLTELLA